MAKSNKKNRNNNRVQNSTINKKENTVKKSGFFTRIKNAFVAGYRSAAQDIKRDVVTVKNVYKRGVDKNIDCNVIVRHATGIGAVCVAFYNDACMACCSLRTVFVKS